MCVFLYAHHCVWIRAQMSIDSLFLAVSVCVCMCGCRGGTVKGWRLSHPAKMKALPGSVSSSVPWRSSSSETHAFTATQHPHCLWRTQTHPGDSLSVRWWQSSGDTVSGATELCIVPTLLIEYPPLPPWPSFLSLVSNLYGVTKYSDQGLSLCFLKVQRQFPVNNNLISSYLKITLNWIELNCSEVM